MTPTKMHANEIPTDADLVHRLLAAQFPQWADLPITPVESAGTDNAIYHLGDELAVRLPRIDWAVGQVEKEHYWLPRLAPHLPLALPAPLAMGAPGEGYPWHWSVYQWMEGENASPENLTDPIQAAIDLAQFIKALQSIDPSGGPLAVEHDLRGQPLITRDEQTRTAIAALDGIIDTSAVTTIWETALEAPDWELEPVWFHGDMLPGNLLVSDGRLSAVFDFAGLGVGDPAPDLMIAWALFSGESREAFREAVGVDDATWARGRGHALSQALIFIPYYLETNPVGVANARHTLAAILTEHQHNA